MSSVFTRLKIRTVAIWATNAAGVLGVDGEIPWKSPSDLRFYAQNTRNAVVIMGRKTYQSLPEIAKKNRHIIVLTSRREELLGVRCAGNIDEALGLAMTIATQTDCKREIYFAGGAEVYTQALRLGLVDEVMRTIVSANATAGPDMVYAPSVPPEKYKLANRYCVTPDDEPPLEFQHYICHEIADDFGITRKGEPTSCFYKALSGAKLL